MWSCIFRFQRYCILTVAVKVLMKIGTQMKKFSKSQGKFVEVIWVLQKNVWLKAHFTFRMEFMSQSLSEIRGNHAIVETYGIQGSTEQIWLSQSKHKIIAIYKLNYSSRFELANALDMHTQGFLRLHILFKPVPNWNLVFFMLSVFHT